MRALAKLCALGVLAAASGRGLRGADKLAEDSLIADHYVSDLTAAAAKAPAKKPPAKKPAKPAVACTSKINWESIDGGVHLNGKPFHIKGANWFGAETDLYVVNGLWGKATSLDKMMRFCLTNKINALRIPISLELALNPKLKIPKKSCVECKGELAWTFLDKLFEAAAAHGVVILLDMHRMSASEATELWYTKGYTEADFIEGWVNVLKKWGKEPNLMGIDLKNEPHGAATWGLNEPKTDWNKAAERIVQGIVKAVPTFDRLIFVEGVGSDAKRWLTPPPPDYELTDPAAIQFWGSNLAGVREAPIDFGSEKLNNKLVYSAHIYGPDLYPLPYFKANNFPDNMPEIWDKQIGFVEDVTGKALVLGEWGGKNKGADAKLQVKFVDWMSKHCIGDAFIWALNPNSSDLGGLLDKSWTKGDKGKLKLMNELQPFPSQFLKPIKAGQICVDPGKYPVGAVCEAAKKPAA